MICKKATEQKLGLKEVGLKANIIKVGNKEQEYIYGRMAANSLANGQIVTYMDMEYIYGMMAEYFHLDQIYEGEYRLNQMHGRGLYIWPDGRKYNGEYSKDKKNGFGVYYW